MIKGNSIMAKFAAAAGVDAEAAAFAAEEAKLLSTLDKLHWNPKTKTYCDAGKHSNKGTFKEHIVFQCQDPSTGQTAQFDTPSDRPSYTCPPNQRFSKFQWQLGDGQGGLMKRQKFAAKKTGYRFVQHTGYVSLFPVLLRLLPADSDQLGETLKVMRDPDQLWSGFGLRSLSKADLYYNRENAPGDAPYWRGSIWININYLALYGLQHYKQVEGPHQALADKIYNELRADLIAAMYKSWADTSFLFEQYNQDSGDGQRNHPFAGWSSLISLIIAERY